ncbi:hypothetical protein FB381_1286 [Nocardioides albertanoniae]|uniref:Uncharacterized protein n=1 Tax=Nocardioides albertanoniae TaxID=1175486 RepID=A0A543A495_9ACTN|nr:hypothetical protein [Nocardioides albertanoniae]TQL67410.1 hypothetical protein FB381_1286 [Nocardioides albertanoniae]
MPSRSLDYTPLGRRVGLRARLAAIAGNNLYLLGMTVSVLLTAAGLAVFLVQLITGHVGEFGWFCLGFLVPCGVLAAADGLRQAGRGGSVSAFARANGLEAIHGTTATSYAGSLFADGSHLVLHSVRTRGETFVEVGDLWPLGGAARAADGVEDPGSAAYPERRLFLRVKMGFSIRAGMRAEVVTPELDERLRSFAGAYSLEISGSELTVFGRRELRPKDPLRMAEAFGLAQQLAERLAEVSRDRRRGRGRGAEKANASGIPIPQRHVADDAGLRTMGALKVIGITVALLVIGPLAIAVFMSAIDGGLRGREGVAQVVTLVVVSVVCAVIAGVVRMITTPRRPKR